MWSLSQTSASGQVDTVFPRLGLFSWHSLHLLTYRRTSWLMPGHQAIIRTAVSVAFLPGWVSWALAITMCLCLGGMKGTTPLKMTPLWMVKTSFCCSNPFSASEHCFQMPLYIRLMTSWKSRFNPSSILMSDWVTRSDWTELIMSRSRKKLNYHIRWIQN